MSNFPPIKHIMPFEPFHSSGQKGSFPVITDDRRDFYAKLSGVSQGQAVNVIGTGPWPNILVSPAAPLTPILELHLPRPEPVVLTWGVYREEINRYARVARFIAHGVDFGGPALLANMEGRLFIEWGAGQATQWTYCDLASGSLQIPAASFVKLMAWTNFVNGNVRAQAQVGYMGAKADCTWTIGLSSLLANQLVTVPIAPYVREITGYFRGQAVGENGYCALRDLAGQYIQHWYEDSAIAPNPQAIPYNPVSVPVGPAAFVEAGVGAFVGPGAIHSMAVCAIRI